MRESMLMLSVRNDIRLLPITKKVKNTTVTGERCSFSFSRFGLTFNTATKRYNIVYITTLHIILQRRCIKRKDRTAFVIFFPLNPSKSDSIKYVCLINYSLPQRADALCVYTTTLYRHYSTKFSDK